jgi:two-component system chemotaxis response regulator CheY
MLPKRGVVLVIEDDPQARELFRTACGAAGYSVVAVGDGTEGLRRIEDDPPDVIVLDLLLPRVGGLDVLQEVRANPRTSTTPVIVVTGSSMEHRVPPDSFEWLLRKPVSPEELVETIDIAVRLRRA